MTQQPNQIGEAYVRITATTEGVDAGIDSAKKKTEDFARTAQDTAKKSSGSIGSAIASINRALSRSISIISALIAKLTLLVTVATTFYTIGNRIGKRLFGDPDELEKQIEMMDKVEERTAKAVESLRKAERALTDIRAKESATGSASFIDRIREERLEREIREQRNTLIALTRNRERQQQAIRDTIALEDQELKLIRELNEAAREYGDEAVERYRQVKAAAEEAHETMRRQAEEVRELRRQWEESILAITRAAEAAIRERDAQLSEMMRRQESQSRAMVERLTTSMSRVQSLLELHLRAGPRRGVP